jgi:hypothetical protein
MVATTGCMSETRTALPSPPRSTDRAGIAAYIAALEACDLPADTRAEFVNEARCHLADLDRRAERVLDGETR